MHFTLSTDPRVNAMNGYRTALITGASSGIGRGLALFFAARGTRVFAAARREEELRTLQAEAARSGGAIEPVTLDVADADQVLARIRSIDAEVGGLDLVVANAGVGLRSNARQLDWAAVQQTIAVNVTGAAATLAAALPLMVARNAGHLVGVSSLAAFRPVPHNATYSASKAFLSSFLEGMRLDLDGTGVRVTIVHPGFVRTEMTARSEHPRPLMWEVDRAVSFMGAAILRGDAEVSFPWPLAWAVRAARLLPSSLYLAATRWLRPRDPSE